MHRVLDVGMRSPEARNRVTADLWREKILSSLELRVCSAHARSATANRVPRVIIDDEPVPAASMLIFLPGDRQLKRKMLPGSPD